MTTSPVRVGVIGVGFGATVQIPGFQSEGAEVTAVCARRPERALEAAERFDIPHAFTDYEDMVKSNYVDAVSVVTMWDQHTEPTLAALDAGKHVFLEKPMASTVDDCARIVAAADAALGFLMVGHICRFNPRYAAAKREIEAGSIGRIVALSSRRNIPAAWTPEILNKIGPIIGDAIHDTDLMLWFTGAHVVSAYAQTVDVRGLRYPDIGQTMYRFDSGATATLETVWCMPEKTPFDIDERMSIIGTEGFIHIQDTFPNIGICTKDGFRSPDTTYWPELHGRLSGALREEFLYFARCVQDGTPPTIITPAESMEAVRTTLAALRERTLTATWVMPPKYPYPADGPGAISDRIELLVNQAYSTLRWVDGWIESHEEFVADSAENASLLAGLIRKVVQQGALLDEETQFSELLRRYHRNFGESARIIETGDAVRLSVRLSPAEVEKLRQETDNEAPETVNPEAPDDPPLQPSP